MNKGDDARNYSQNNFIYIVKIQQNGGVDQ